ncbi:MAG: hypothetical protein ABI432_03505 [Flavobacteriales bacterium]
MNHQLLTIMYGSLLATSVCAQTASDLRPTTNWLGAHQQCFGPNACASWLLDQMNDSVELYVTTDHSLVLVDRALFNSTDNATAYLHKGLLGLAGTHLVLIGDVVYVNDSLMRGDYEGLVGGMPVSMTQFVQERNGVPLAVVQVITRKQGSAPLCQESALAIALGAIATHPLETIAAPARATARR